MRFSSKNPRVSVEIPRLPPVRPPSRAARKFIATVRDVDEGARGREDGREEGRGVIEYIMASAGRIFSAHCVQD